MKRYLTAVALAAPLDPADARRAGCVDLRRLVQRHGTQVGETTMHNGMVGKYVIVRCRDAGVHAGILLAHEGREALLKNSRRLWYWKPANGKKFLSGVAVAGLNHESKIGAPLPRIHLTETCEIIECTPLAATSISEFPDDDENT